MEWWRGRWREWEWAVEEPALSDRSEKETLCSETRREDSRLRTQERRGEERRLRSQARGASGLGAEVKDKKALRGWDYRGLGLGEVCMVSQSRTTGLIWLVGELITIQPSKRQ
jgi:hypothetical protein